MQVVFRPRFSIHAVPSGDHPALARMIERWAEIYGLRPDGLERSADRENWVENAAQLLAAVDAGLRVLTVPRGKDLSFALDRADPKTPAMPLGALSKDDLRFLSEHAHGTPKLVWPDAGSFRAAHRYAFNPAFFAAAGRFVRAAHIPDGREIPKDGPQAIATVVRQVLKTSRHERPELLLKIISQPKYAEPARLPLPKDADDASIDRALVETLGYTLAHLEGQREAVLVQEKIPMTHEYRLAVVDGVPFAGAGCIDAFCPLDRLHGSWSFDPQMEGVRGAGDAAPQPEIADRYRVEGARIAQRLAAEDPAMRDFTLDLATTTGGRTVMIEANPICNAGLYAMNFAPVFRAAARTAEHRSRVREPQKEGVER